MKIRTGTVALWGLTAFALAVRVVHLRWGFPEVFEEATPVHQAIGFWGRPGGGLDLNPHFFKYPSLTFYLNFIGQAIWFLILSVKGSVGSLNEFRQLLAQDPNRAVLLGRSIQAALGALAVIPTVLLGRRLAGPAAGWIAGGLWALLPVAVIESRLVDPDMALTLFAAAALAASVRLADRGERSDYLWTGLWIGLAAASKYPGALLLAALLAAHVHRVRLGGSGPAGIVLASELWQSLVTAAVAFAATTPYVLLDASTAWADISFERRHMALGHLGREGGRAITYYLGRAIPHGWTLPVAAAAAVGLALLLARRESRARASVPAAFTLIVLAVLGSWKMAAPRYLLPLAPVASAWAAAAAVLLPRLALRRPAPVWLALLLGAALAVAPALGARAVVREGGRTDSRVAAGRWIREHVPAGSTLLVERYGPEPDPARYNVLYLPFHGITPHLYDPAYSPPFYATFDYLVFSSEVSARYLARPREYPAQASFYAAMDRAFEEVAAYPSGDYLGPTVRILHRKPEMPIKDLSHIPDGFFEQLKGNDRLAEYFSALGVVLARQERDSLGFRMLTEAVDMAPADAKAWGNLGVTRMQKGQLDGALEALRRARDLAPRNAEIAYDLGVLHQKSGEAGQAADAFREAILMRPEMEDAYIGLARALIEDDHYAGARGVLHEFLNRFPRSDKRETARTVLAELAKMGPGRP